jgi:ABC-type nitrate/sulfonate/bicarbonate transport system substrate-binding protein
MGDSGQTDFQAEDLPSIDIDFSSSLSRRGLLMRAGGAAVGVGMASTFARAAAAANRSIAATKLTKVSLELDYIKNTQFAGMLWGLEKGYYRDEGIALNISAQTATTDPVTLVAAGHTTIGMQAGDELVLARSKGIPIKTFAADIQKNPVGFTSLASLGIKKLGDIRGHTVGFPPAYNNQIPLVLSLGGLKPSDIKLRTIGFDPTSLLVNHQIDVAGSTFLPNTPITLKLMGYKTNFIPWADYGYPFYTDCFFVNEHTLAKQASMLKAFVRATQRAWVDVYKHPHAVTDLIVKKYGQGSLKTQQQYLELMAFKPLMFTSDTKKHGFAVMTPERWAKGIKLFANFKLIPKAFPVTDLYVGGFVKP